MQTLLILNEAPLGNEKTCDALRLAMALQKDHPEAKVRVFLMAVAAGTALAGQSAPQGELPESEYQDR